MLVTLSQMQYEGRHSTEWRGIVPFSRELTGVVLKYGNFGLHLDSSKRTTNLENGTLKMQALRLIIFGVKSFAIFPRLLNSAYRY